MDAMYTGANYDISIHAPTRGATDFALGNCYTVRFQSTLPRGERRHSAQSLLFWWTFQSTLPRGERRGRFVLMRRTQNISIHAPTRGATIYRTAQILSMTFQSTLPRGERHYPQYRAPPSLIISIHAPTRGATHSISSYRLIASISIHAPTRGATSLTQDVCSILLFQSTLPRGERQQAHLAINRNV